jgi:hypothetical protein
MKKHFSCGLILSAGFSLRAFAKAGYANDGLEFVLFLAGFLLLVAGLLAGINYLYKNRKELVHRVMAFLKKNLSGVFH